MQASTWTSLLGVAGQLALGAYALFAPLVAKGKAESEDAVPPVGRTAFSTSLGLLCLVFAVWTFAAAAHGETGAFGWHALDLAFSPFVPPLGLALIIFFVGPTRPRQRLLRVAFGGFGALSLGTLVVAAVEPLRPLLEGPVWPVAYLAGFFPTVAAALVLLLRHRRRAPLADRRRVDGIRWGLIVAAALALTEFAADLGADVPRLGHLASLTTAAALTWLGFRHGLLPPPQGARGVVLAVAAGCVLAAVHFTLIISLARDDAMLVGGLTLFSAFGAVISAAVVRDAVRHRARLAQLALQGRMATQLAHDLRNPLTALTGGIDLLATSRQRGEPPAEELVALLRRQVDRLQATTAAYVRSVAVRAQIREMDLDTLIDEVLAPTPEVEVESDPGVIDADPALLVPAIQNLVRNALDAGEEVRLRVHAESNVVRFEVEDDGPGWTPLSRQLALEGFYTTKAQGTGLGVSFARRVAEAHGGVLELGLEGRRPATSAVALCIPGRVRRRDEQVG